MSTFFPSFLPLLIIIIVAAAMNRPLRRLRSLGATSPDTARPISDIPAGEQRHLRTWVARGVVREATPGFYWYDAQAHAVRQKGEAKIAAVVVIVLGLGALALIWWLRGR